MGAFIQDHLSSSVCTRLTYSKTVTPERMTQCSHIKPTLWTNSEIIVMHFL